MIKQASGDSDRVKVRSEVAKLLAESILSSPQIQVSLTHRFIHATTPEEFKATFQAVCQEITKPAEDYEAIFKRDFEVMFGQGSYQIQLKPKISETTKSSAESATEIVQSVVKAKDFLEGEKASFSSDVVKIKSTKGSSSISNEYRSILFSRVDSTTLDQVESFPTKYIYNNNLAISSKQQQQLKSNPSWISAILSLPRDLLFGQVAYADEIPTSSDDVSCSNSILQQEETWSVLHKARGGDPHAQLELRRRFPISAEASDVINDFYKAWNDPILGFKNYAHNRLGFSWFLPGSMDDLGEVCLNSAMALVGVASIPKIAEEYKKVQFAYQAYRKTQAMANRSPSDRIQHEAAKTLYRQHMDKPAVQDPKLANIIKDLYKPNSKVGSGSTADAARCEIATNKKVGHKFHLEKSNNYIKGLENWLKDNPTASTSDRAAAENILSDLKDAIGKKPWYSQTKPPKP